MVEDKSKNLVGLSAVEAQNHTETNHPAGSGEVQKALDLYDEPDWKRGMPAIKNPKTTDWIETYTNKRFYPLEPDMELICIEDIAHALAHICRFNGHTKRFYSVGEHSLSCLGLARRMGLSYTDRLAALMHDASEAYLADIPRPIKRAMHAYSAWEHTLQQMICRKWEIPYPFPDVIHKIDDIMLATERRDLFISPNHWPSLTADPSYDINVESGYGMEPAIVKDTFINEFYNLRKVLRKA